LYVCLTLTVQLQPNETERARRAHNRSAACCNGLLDADNKRESMHRRSANRGGQRRSIGARIAFPGATPSTARPFATTDTPFTITC